MYSICVTTDFSPFNGARNLSSAELRLRKSQWPSTLVACVFVSALSFTSSSILWKWKLCDFSGLLWSSLSSCYDLLYVSCYKWKSCYAWVDQPAQMFSPLHCHTGWDFRLQEQYLNCTMCACESVCYDSCLSTESLSLNICCLSLLGSSDL